MNKITQTDPLALLRRTVAAIENHGQIAEAVHVGTGHADIDLALGGGLARGRVHELYACDPADASSAMGFATMLAQQLDGGVIWVRDEAAERLGGGLHAAGFREIGFDPGRLIFVLMPDPRAVLRAAADVVRCPEIGVAVIELWRSPRLMDLTASRRLALAAKASGVTALLLLVAAEPVPSAAQTRWAVRAAPSRPLEANAPGHPALEVELLRQRGGPAGGCWRVEWDRDQAIFRAWRADNASPSRAVVSLPVRRSIETSDPFRRTG